MSDLTAFEKRKLERLLNMGSGFVLNFSDRTFAEFFDDYRIAIDDPKYKSGGSSKANRLRTFWTLEPNHLVCRVLEGLIQVGISERCLGESGAESIAECQRIAQRLASSQPVSEISAFDAASDERDFEVLADHIRAAIEKNQPEGGLDRLHTFVIKFLRSTCEARGLPVDREKPLHSVLGEYIKHLRAHGELDSQMTERILKSSISVLEAFNEVRNNRSLAHDNPVLNYEESLLIFNHVAASIRFIKALEMKRKP